MKVQGGLFRSAFLWIIFFGITPLFIFAAAFSLFFPGGPNLSHRIHLSWCKFCVRFFGIELEVVHPERVVKDRPVIFFANHQSILDIIVCGAVLDTQYRWTARESLFKIPVLGKGMKRTGYIRISRSGSAGAMKSFYEAAERIKEGNSLIIFPEGTRTKDGRLLPFKKGGFIIAHRAEVTIQCLSISHTFALLPNQKGIHWIQRFNPGRVQVHIHEPMEALWYNKFKVEDFKEKVREQIKSEIVGGKE